MYIYLCNSFCLRFNECVKKIDGKNRNQLTYNTQSFTNSCR